MDKGGDLGWRAFAFDVDGYVNIKCIAPLLQREIRLLAIFGECSLVALHFQCELILVAIELVVLGQELSHLDVFIIHDLASQFLCHVLPNNHSKGRGHEL